MSWRTKIANKLGGKPSLSEHSNTFNYEAMVKAGFQVITTERIYDRQREEKNFNDLFDLKPEKFNAQSPEERFEFYCTQLELIWGNYTAYHKAWFRAGSAPEFAMLLTSVENMKSYTDMAIERTRHNLYILNAAIERIEKEPSKIKVETQTTGANPQQNTQTQKALNSLNQANKLRNKKAQLVRNFYITWLVLLMFEYIRKTANLSWKNEDVNPPITLAIQTVQPIQQAYPQTTLDNAKQMDTAKTKQNGNGKTEQNWGKPKYDAEKEENKQ